MFAFFFFFFDYINLYKGRIREWIGRSVSETTRINILTRDAQIASPRRNAFRSCSAYASAVCGIVQHCAISTAICTGDDKGTHKSNVADGTGRMNDSESAGSRRSTMPLLSV